MCFLVSYETKNVNPSWHLRDLMLPYISCIFPCWPIIPFEREAQLLHPSASGGWKQSPHMCWFVGPNQPHRTQERNWAALKKIKYSLIILLWSKERTVFYSLCSAQTVLSYPVLGSGLDLSTPLNSTISCGQETLGSIDAKHRNSKTFCTVH